MRFFDVIFATRHFDSETPFALWRTQEAGDAEFVVSATELESRYSARLTEAAGGLDALLGFNITMSIGAMLPGLPTTFLATTCEFPAVLSLFQRCGSDLAAWVCPFTGEITWRSPAPDRAVLLVSHVDYITGQDIVDDTIKALAAASPARDLRYTVIVDGAHGIGNIATVADVGDLRASFEEHLNVEDFVYIFDHNKWLHGFPGLSVALHTGVRAPAIECVFPRPAHPAFGEFGEPVSVSFNPLLPQWTANIMGPAELAFDTDALKSNLALTRTFWELTSDRTFPGLDVFHANSNMAMLRTGDPRALFRYLEERGFRTHLMGASRVRGETPGGAGGVRLTFSSLSVDQDDVQALVDAVAGYRP